jgi:hypothetical protein
MFDSKFCPHFIDRDGKLSAVLEVGRGCQYSEITHVQEAFSRLRVSGFLWLTRLVKSGIIEVSRLFNWLVKKSR